jgi:hypothetical protein
MVLAETDMLPVIVMKPVPIGNSETERSMSAVSRLTKNSILTQVLDERCTCRSRQATGGGGSRN